MGRLRVGLVGMGRGSVYVSQFQNHARTEVDAICDVNPEILEEKRATYGLRGSQAFRNPSTTAFMAPRVSWRMGGAQLGKTVRECSITREGRPGRSIASSQIQAFQKKRRKAVKAQANII